MRTCIGIAALGLALGTTACAKFHETYHFAGVDEVTAQPLNYYRVEFNGSAYASKARYIAGYYDERAVDLFFNEIKSTPGKEDDIEAIFVSDQVVPGSAEKIVPLTAENGTFLMVFSTNAKAITDTIGQFAENQVVADSLTNLLNSREIARLREHEARTGATQAARMAAVSAELAAMIAALPAGASPPRDETIQGTLRLVNSIAAALGNAQGFQSLDQAAEWFETPPDIREGK